MRFRRPFRLFQIDEREQSLANPHFRRQLITPRRYVARMTSSLESGRNAFFQSARLEFDCSKADTDSQRVAISRSFTCSSPLRLSNQFLHSYCVYNFISSADTVTAPTEEMYAYATRVASLGDDVFGTDECTNTFEAHVAKLAGKEAGLFALSGTMSNQLALRTHLSQPPYRYICSANAFVRTN